MGLNRWRCMCRAPIALSRRIAQIGLVDADQARGCRPEAEAGSTACLAVGDLWRWDGFRAWAEDAPSAAALRLEQLNKLEALKQELTRTEAQADGARAAHEALSQQLADVTEADRRAREARRAADQRMAETARQLSRAEADRNLAQGKLETLTLAVDRHKEDAMAARAQLREAEGALTGSG